MQEIQKCWLSRVKNAPKDNIQYEAKTKSEVT